MRVGVECSHGVETGGDVLECVPEFRRYVSLWAFVDLNRHVRRWIQERLCPLTPAWLEGASVAPISVFPVVGSRALRHSWPWPRPWQRPGDPRLDEVVELAE